jgi:hypothetical protein
MIKVEGIVGDRIETYLIEVKKNGSQYEMYLDGSLRGSTGELGTLLEEVKELAGSFAKNTVIREIESL